LFNFFVYQCLLGEIKITNDVGARSSMAETKERKNLIAIQPKSAHKN